jgi:hypothetical protein
VGAITVNQSRGAVYVYHASSEGSWSSSSTPTATLVNIASLTGDVLGSSVALSADGKTALVGARGANNRIGAAYIFRAPSEASWSSSFTPDATLTLAGGSTYQQIGNAVALSRDGTTALVGAPGSNGAGEAAYVFRTSSESSWSSSSTPTATLTNGSSGDGFGYSVALSPDGTTALIGAWAASAVGSSNAGAGAAYIFQVPSEASWSTSSTPAAALSDSAGTPNEGFGDDVALSADATTALIGAWGTDGSGAAFIYRSSRAAMACAAPSVLAFTVEPPARSTAGSAFITEVSVEDSSGNVVSPGNGTPITLAITPGTGTPGATLSCTPNPVEASGGVARFRCSIAKAGTGYTLIASAASLPSVVSNSFDIGALTRGPPTGGGPAGKPSPPPPLALSRVAQSHRTWREHPARITRGRRPARAKRKAPVGTTLSYWLNERALVVFVFTLEAPGRFVHGHCTTVSMRNKRNQACVRMTQQGVLYLSGRAGANRLFFAGQLARRRWLPAGRYTLTIAASDAAGQLAKPKQLEFTIIR